MTASRPLILWSLVGVAALLAAAGWSYATMTDARDAAARSARELADCDRLVAEIRAARGRPALAVTPETRTTDLSATLGAALAAAEVPPGDLARVTPEAARRLAETDYEERPTRLSLRNLTFAQAALFLQALSDVRGGLSVDAVRLVAAKEDGDAAVNTWTAEVTISTLIYAPRSPANAPRTPPSGRSP